MVAEVILLANGQQPLSHTEVAGVVKQKGKSTQSVLKACVGAYGQRLVVTVRQEEESGIASLFLSLLRRRIPEEEERNGFVADPV